MKILVTGAAGYIGCELAHVLAEQGNTVHALIRTMAAANKLNHPFIKIFQGDILDRASLSRAMKGCEQVYHTAGFVKICARDPSHFYLHNVTGTENVLLEALHSTIKKLVFTSTCGVWGPTGDHVFTEEYPRIACYDSDYEISKMLAEKSVREYNRNGLQTVIVNPTKVYGFGTKSDAVHYNAQLRKWIVSRFILLPWKTRVESNFAFIDDVIRGHILAMEKGSGGEKYILGGDNISLRNLFQSIAAQSSHTKIIIRLPGWILRLWAIYEVIQSGIQKKDPRITPALIPRLFQHARYSSQSAIDRLGYTITPIDEGLLKTINHVKQL